MIRRYDLDSTAADATSEFLDRQLGGRHGSLACDVGIGTRHVAQDADANDIFGSGRRDESGERGA